MPKLQLDLPHLLGQAEAMRRLKEKFAAARAMYEGQLHNLQEEWQDHVLSFGFQAMGMSVSGTIAVEAETVKLAANLPLAASLFKGPIEARIRQEVDALLATPPANT